MYQEDRYLTNSTFSHRQAVCTLQDRGRKVIAGGAETEPKTEPSSVLADQTDLSPANENAITVGLTGPENNRSARAVLRPVKAYKDETRSKVGAGVGAGWQKIKMNCDGKVASHCK